MYLHVHIEVKELLVVFAGKEPGRIVHTYIHVHIKMKKYIPKISFYELKYCTCDIGAKHALYAHNIAPNMHYMRIILHQTCTICA